MKPNLNELLKLFLDLDLEFVVIGGFASALHGSSMVTRDLDLCLLLTPENIDLLRSTLKDLNPKLRTTTKKLSFLDHPDTNQNFKNLYLETDLGIVDFVSHVTGVGDFERVTENAIQIEIFGSTCKVISIEDLIACKKEMRRPKDLMVASELEEIVRRS